MPFIGANIAICLLASCATKVRTSTAGYFLAYSNVRADVTGDSLKELLQEFKSIRSGDVTADEVRKAQANYRTDLVQDYDNLGSVLQSAIKLLRNHRPFDGPAADLKASAGVTQSDLNQLASSAIPLEHGVLVLVGDRKTILDELQELNLPQPIELDVKDEPK